MSQASLHFVMIFRQSQGALDESTRMRRDTEIRAWAAEMTAQGIHLGPHSLGPDRFEWGAKPRSENPDNAIGALLFVEAKDFDQAKTIAGSHPGLRYGASIELRPWTIPGRP